MRIGSKASLLGLDGLPFPRKLFTNKFFQDETKFISRGSSRLIAAHRGSSRLIAAHRGSSRLIAALFTFVLIHLAMPAEAQLFTEVSTTQANLTTQASQQLTAYQQKADTKSVKLVSIANPNTLSAGSSFTLPGFTQSLTPSTVISNAVSSTEYSYSATLFNKTGVILLARKDGGVMGKITFPDHSWEIWPLQDGLSVLREVDLSRSTINDCGMTEIQNSSIEQSDFCGSPSDCTAQIDILILFAQDFDAGLMMPNGTINWAGTFIRALMPKICELEINTAFINSGILNKTVRCLHNPVGSFSFAYSSPSNPDVDIVTLKNSTSAATLRNTAGADLICLVTLNTYPNARGVSVNQDFCGGLFAECTFASIVTGSFALSATHTFSHEIAHELGARHELTQDANSSCGHGFSFTGNTMGVLNTLLFANTTQRIVNYSSPVVIVDGTATGTSTNDNARKIRNSGCMVANYRIEAFNCSFSLPFIVCTSTPAFTVSGNVNLPPPDFGFPETTNPLSFYWERSHLDDMSNPEWVGSTQNLTIYPSFPSNLGCWYYRLTVQSANGITVVSPVKKMCVYNCVVGGDDRTKIEGQETQSILGFNVWPNPTNGEIAIQWTENMDKNIVQFFNSFGQQVSPETSPIGNQLLKADFTNFPDGVYFIQMDQLDGSMIKKRIVLNHNN